MIKQINAVPVRVFTYDVNDDPNMVGLTQVVTSGVGADYNAFIFVKDSMMLNLRGGQKENAKTLIHEAYHGFLRSTNEDSAYAIEPRCVL